MTQVAFDIVGDDIVWEDDHDTEHRYPADVYEVTTKAVGSQQWVANQWAEGKLPLHDTLRSSTGNFKGHQYDDGSGKLKHYRTIEAVRTLNQTVISNTQCYARGFAHCSTPHAAYCPKRTLESLPLTQLTSLGGDWPSWKHITAVDKRPTLDGENTPAPDANGYDRLIVFDLPDEGEMYYRASKEAVDTDPLAPDDARDFVDAADLDHRAAP